MSKVIPWQIKRAAQGNLTDSLGYQEPDNLPLSLASILTKIMMEEPYEADEHCPDN